MGYEIGSLHGLGTMDIVKGEGGLGDLLPVVGAVFYRRGDMHHRSSWI